MTNMNRSATKEHNMATTTTAADLWLWETTKGHLVNVYPIATDLNGWYAEAPGEREPQTYRLDNTKTGESITHTVSPIEPWNAYDAIVDRCVAWGWKDTTYVDPGKCEHGLSADLCAGPNHYPADDAF